MKTIQILLCYILFCFGIILNTVSCLLNSIAVTAFLFAVPMMTAIFAEEPCPQMKTLTSEIEDGLKRRGLADGLKNLGALYPERYFAGDPEIKNLEVKSTSCRLAWIDWMLRNPVQAIGAAEVFTRQLHEAAKRQDGAMVALVGLASEKLVTVKAGATPKTDAVTAWQSAEPVPDASDKPDPLLTQIPGLKAIAKSATDARKAYLAAMAPLSNEERALLRAELYRQTTETQNPMNVIDKDVGRRVFNALEKTDQASLNEAAKAIASVCETSLLKDLAGIPARETSPVAGVKGSLTACAETPAGKIIIGGKDKNEYQLDEMKDVYTVIDQGGDDVYIEGTVSESRPVLIVIDLSGNDIYRGVKPGIQGGAILGISLLFDAAGNDIYDARDVAQGSSLCGAGILVDLSGNDRYLGLRRVQGHAVAGTGILLDKSGNDDYRGAMLAQGVGGPLGIGILDDLEGNDHYYAGGLYASPWDDSPGYAGFSQGVGIGPRWTANGGIGVILDGGGDDIYESDCMSHAGGYWFAAGFARDFDGNDQRVGSTRTAFDGSERKVARYQRYGSAFGCHFAVGILFDDTGDDSYFADFAGVTFGWDGAVVAICDFKGNDRYNAPGHGVACACNASFAVIFDAAGDDVYSGQPPAMIKQESEYHPNLSSAKNYSFLIDLDGTDQYPEKLENKKEYERGWAGGFLIDR